YADFRMVSPDLRQVADPFLTCAGSSFLPLPSSSPGSSSSSAPGRSARARGARACVRSWRPRSRLRREFPAREAPRLRHAIVLAHGLFGFDEIVVAGRRHRYFRNISERLAGPEARFHLAGVPPWGSIAVRAEKLVALLRELPGERVNVIAHSMGGLDARFAISRLGLSERVACLVPIGTPHRGTPLVDLPLPRLAARLLGAAGLTDLTPRAL